MLLPLSSSMLDLHVIIDCAMCPGDLLGSGTQSGPEADEAGRLLGPAAAASSPSACRMANSASSGKMGTASSCWAGQLAQVFHAWSWRGRGDGAASTPGSAEAFHELLPGTADRYRVAEYPVLPMQGPSQREQVAVRIRDLLHALMMQC